ncbi:MULTISPECIES: thiol-disulfide oxidoreductase DCC family protein [Sutcliffiella]|uniref:Thiol-disulfide oxidoreductase n=1 Tax=Sutcliffiella cohnii TaxID=33932 RepID=A0A223KQ28_9BACI|nr:MULTISPECIES: thiol-disulfide oxidoreductase DCC family protein [Sutcliffiella]AST91516.1 thiol-disulfide oxidoreductase [Sutcliffiella cohnii]WBL17347.1 thiol-disulfide oxidoreductase DCC family protein [Sutcliffiella sp. NC1]
MRPIILFDGVCNFCESSVQFIMKRDAKELFLFASLQGKTGQQLIEQHSILTDSVVLVTEKGIFTKSDAALKICKHLTFPWKLAYVFIIIPRAIRDWIYDKFAKNRYKWFGKKAACMLPTPEERARFLE